MSRQQHPDAEALARYQAGDVGGFRGRRLAAHVHGCARCASATDDLAAVSTLLASVPAPSMPDAVERQITAALAAEAATRQAASPAAADGSAAGGQRSRHLRPVRSDRSHTRGFRPAMAAVSAAACLLLVGFGYLLSQTGSSSSSSSAISAAAPAASAPAAGAANGHAAASAVPQPAGKAISPTRSALQPLEGQQPAPFLVTNSGTGYQQATLAAQVRGELNRRGTPSASAGTHPATGSQPAGSAGGLTPSPSLIGCVSTVTGNVPPSLVDLATYEGKSAYVIAVSDRAWVVGPGCSASNPDVIASVALPA